MKIFRSRSLALAVLAAVLSACGGAPPETAAPAASAPPPEQAAPPAPAAAGAEGAETAPGDAVPGEDPSVPDPPPFTPVGVPECDKFVEKYVACVDVRVPADQKERLMRELHVHRARWRELEKMEDGRLAAGLACRGVAHRLKGDLIVEYGCEF